MSQITSQVSDDGSQVIIQVSGRFDFSLHREFRNAYKDHDSPVSHFVVDMARAEYMDSSALGMLLMLREHAGGDQRRVSISNASASVGKILKIANFDKLFQM